jgi:hypothetical protein
MVFNKKNLKSQQFQKKRKSKSIFTVLYSFDSSRAIAALINTVLAVLTLQYFLLFDWPSQPLVTSFTTPIGFLECLYVFFSNRSLAYVDEL